MEARENLPVDVARDRADAADALFAKRPERKPTHGDGGGTIASAERHTASQRW